MRVITGLIAGVIVSAVATDAATRKNVVLIYVDDLRMQINKQLARDFMITPELDNFLSESVYARNAMVQQGVCSPSRASLLTGRRPDTTGIFDLWHYFRNLTGYDWVTLPQAFKKAGYDHVAGGGKVFHPGHASGAGFCSNCTGDDVPFSWTDPYFHAPNARIEPWKSSSNYSWLNVDPSFREESAFPDAQIVDNAISSLTNFSKRGESFFVGVGLHKPHLPFIAPKKYFDLYANTNVSEPTDDYPTKGMPEIAWSDWGELRQYADIAKLDLPKTIANVMPEQVTIDLRRAYYAATSFTSFQIGRVLQAIDNLGLRDNTIVAMVGDHGWQLNDHVEWCKHTDFTIVTRAPFIIRDPDYSHLAGTELTVPLEHVDLFPTLLDLAGLEQLPGLEGFSIKPLLDNPSLPWKKAAFSQYPRDGVPGPGHDESFPRVMGYTMFTEEPHWKYTMWVNFSDTDPKKPYPIWDQVVAEELYDHRNDTGPIVLGAFDNVNLADDPSYAQLKEQLKQQLLAGPWGSMPEWMQREKAAEGFGPGAGMNLAFTPRH